MSYLIRFRVLLDENKKWNGEVRFLNLSALKILSAQISADDLAKFLEMRAPDLSVEKVTIDHDLTIQALWRKIPVSMENSLDFLGKSDTQNFYLRASLRSLHIGPISIPTSFLKIWGHLKIPLNTNSDTPFNIIPSGLTLSNNQVSIP